MKLRAYLVDDEPLEVERLRRLLEQTGRVEVTGSSTEPEQAVAALTGDPPDVCFLDIQMPRLNGFDVLGKLPRQPIVIFTTAYDQYANGGICCEFYRLFAEADRARSRESSDRGRGIWAEALSIAGW